MIQKLQYLSPFFKSLFFLLLPLFYYLTGGMNYSQAGQMSILAFFTLITLFTWREVFEKKRWLTGLLTLATALLCIYIGFQVILRSIFGVEQDDVIVIQALFDTELGESREFVQQYARFMIAPAVISAVFFSAYWALLIKSDGVYLKQRDASAYKHYPKWAVLFTLLLIASHLNSTQRRFNPFFYFPHYHSKWQTELAAAEHLLKQLKNTASDADLASMVVSSETKNRTLVLVIGESDTRKNWSLYGYERPTTPMLQKMRDKLLVFEDVLAADGATIGSITKMLSQATLAEPSLWQSKANIITIAKRMGYKTYWLSNNGSANRGAISILATQCDVTVFTNRGRSRGEGSMDEVLFGPYGKALGDPASKKLIIINLLGAHPAYNFRYPKSYAKFEYEFGDKVAKALYKKGRAPWAVAFRNMYDSAVFYQDHILSQLLQRLMDRAAPNSAWLYIADHGQDVSHHNNFSGHNAKVREMWEVPMLYWQSEPLLVAKPQLAARAYQADHLLHTLLGRLGISGKLYDERRDILSSGFDNKADLPRKMRNVPYDR